jgi:hypothetical protein
LIVGSFEWDAGLMKTQAPPTKLANAIGSLAAAYIDDVRRAAEQALARSSGLGRRQFTTSASGRGATRRHCTVWTVRCQRMPNNCSCSRRAAAQLHVRIAALGGRTL